MINSVVEDAKSADMKVDKNIDLETGKQLVVVIMASAAHHVMIAGIKRQRGMIGLVVGHAKDVVILDLVDEHVDKPVNLVILIFSFYFEKT